MKKRIIAVITALAITITAFTGITMPVGAEDLAPDEITITIGGQEYDPATSGAVDYKPGESFNARLSWDKIPEGVTSFTYHLGNHIKTTNTNGDINVNGTNVGTWKIVDGELIVEFNDNFNSVPNRNCWVNFDGTIPLDPNEQKQGDEYKVEFGDKEIDIKPQYGESDVYVGKSAVSTDNYSITVSEDGRYIVKNRITVTVNNNYASDITLSDVLGDCMTLPEPFNKDDVKLTYTPAENNSEPNSQVESGYTVTQNVNGFDVYLPGEFKVGDRITLEYETELTEEAVKNMLNGDSSQISGVNTASGTFTDVFTEKSKTTNEAYENLQVWKPTLTKSGTLNDDNTITWTVTFDPGFLRNILDGDGNRIDPDKLMEELQKRFGSEFGDTPDDFQSSVDLSSLSITDFTRSNTYDPNSSYTIEFTTKITDDGKHGYYTNDAKLTLMDDVELKAHAAVGIGYGVEKEFVDETTDGKMQWKITIEVPEEATEFTELTINDNPYADNSVKSGYEHKLLPESIKVGGVSINETNGGIKLEENNIIITREYAQAQGWLGEFVEITLETEAVKNGSNNGSLEPNFRYINDVNYTVKYPDGTTGTTSARAEHSSITDVLYEKGGEVIKTPGDIKGNVSDWNAKTTSQVLWYVDVYDFAKYEYDYTVYPFGTKKSGYLFDPDGFEVDLTDTLPENMKLVANSWYAIPTVFAKNKLSECEDPDVRALFSQGLSITDNGGGTLSIRYELSDEARQKITAYLDGLKVTDQWGNSQDVFNLFGSGSGLRLYYITEIADTDKFIEQTPIGQYSSESAEVTFTNTVFGSVNGTRGIPSQADVQLKRTQALAKTTKYNSENDILDIPTCDKNWKTGPFGTQNIPFAIEVNPQRLSLGYDNGRLVIEDVMGTSLRLVEESVVIQDYDTKEYLKKGEYSVEVRTPYYGEDDQRTRIIISMPDGRHLRVTYYAEIAEPPTEFTKDPTTNKILPEFELSDMTNEVHFYLEGSEESFSCYMPTAVVFTSAGAGYNSFLKLFKVDKDNPTDHNGIPGARFELRVVTLDPTSGKFTVADPSKKPVQGTFSNKSSTTYLGVEDPLREIYQVVEVKAPEGYQPDRTPKYYVFQAYLDNTTDNDPATIAKLEAMETNGEVIVVTDSALLSSEKSSVPNEHAPEPVKEKLSLTKVLTGGNIADYARDFNFTLKVLETPYNSNYNLEITSRTASNDEYGNIDFGELTFHEAGTYVLTITEEKGNDPQITYDEKAITITYNVKLDKSKGDYGTLTVKSVTYKYGNGDKTDTAPSFTNTVKDMSVTTAVPTITKKLKGRKLTDGEFTFKISADTTNGIVLPKATEVTNNADGSVNFGEIKFTEAGTYTVTISEKNDKKDNIIYDDHSLKITYTVEEVGEELEVTGTEYDTSACTFENTYTPQPVPAAPTIKKEYTNGTLKGEDFEFTLEAVSNPDSGMTLPTNTTAKNDDKGNVTFGAITFSKVGTYTVKITETNGGKSYVKYATDPVTITYTVTDTNNDGVLEVSSNADNQTPVITNEYLTGSLVISKKVEGDTPTNTDQEFTFDVTFKLDGAPLKEAVYYTKNGNTTENFPIEKGEGKITLKAGQTATITGIPVGTEYTVTETDIPANYTPTAASVSGEITANKTKTAAFVNTYTKPEPEVGSLVISKTVQGDGADLTKSFSFSVTFDYPDETSNTEKFSLKNGGSKTFENLPVGTKYTVTETDYTADGYTTTVTDNNASGTISKDGQKITVEFVNTYTKPEPDVGSLKISKTVQGDGADPDKSFSFSVTFDYPDDTGREDNTETFSLKNGGSKTFENLPVGTKYTVTENFSEVHWTTTVTDNNASGTISKDGQEITVEFVNTYTKPEQPKPEVGSLEISKKVTGDTPADLDKAFSFSVTFDYPDDTGREDNTETFSLKNGGSKTFENLPAGTKYTVTETDYTAYGYTSTSTGANGEITANETKTAAFVNTYKKPEQPQPEFGSLVISKTVQGEGANSEQEFEFTVNLYQQDGETHLTDSFNYSGSKSGKISDGGTITLKDGESVTIEGLPVGTGYTVTEQKVENYKANQDKFTGTIEKGETAKAAFVNTYTQPTKYFDITVSKEVTGSGADKNDEFTFTVTFTDSDKNALGGEFTIILADKAESAITSGGTFTLKDGESVTIKGIPEGTIYTVEETGSKGYTVSSTDASGVLKKNAKVKFTNNKEKQEEQSSEPSTEAPPTTQPTQPAQTAPAPTETTTEQTAPAPVETTTEDDRNRVDGDSDSEDRQPNTANTADFGILLLVMAASCVFAAAAKKKAD